MKRKVWELTVLDNPNRAVGGESDIFYTTDTEAFLIFRLTDADFNPATATLTLVNTSDKSVISEVVPVIDKEIEWEMTEEAIVHSGNWQVQLVYTQEKVGKAEHYTSQVVQFDVQSHLMTGRQPTLVTIEDWNTFMATAQELLAQLEEDAGGIFIDIDELEQQYRDSEQARVDAENVRETNESARQAEESQRASSEQQREENESLREGSETDRVSAEQNRVTAESERNDLYDLVQQKLENGEFVGEKGDTGDGLEYVWNGTQLGVRKEGETEYVYVDLKGDKGDTGEIENLDSSHIVGALGYMPISEADVPDPTWANLQNKPTEFNPTAHTHSIDDVTGLRAELDSVPELTKENVGLGNVDNVKQASKVEHDQLVTDFNEHQTEVTAQLAQTALKLPRAVKYGELKLPDDFPKEVPFKVYKTREGYTHDFDFTPFEYSKKIYISRSGRSDADGLTPETPTRNIGDILTILSNVEEEDVSIVFLDKFFALGFWVLDSIDFGKNIRLASAHEEGTVFGNFAPQEFTTLGDGLFKMTRNSVGKVLLYNVKDVWGNPSEALETSTLDECKQIPNSFYTDGVSVWVNAPSESLESANENIGVLYRLNQPLRFNIESNTLFIDNVKFAREANKSRTYEGLRITGTNQSTAIVRNSYFNYGDRNGFETVNVGNVHLFDCQASYNLIDGFNYHGTGDELITEFNCYASDNGDETQGSANATTAHDGMTISRIGTIGERCYGPVLADVNGCYSYNVGCAMYDSMNPGSFAFFFSETGAETPGAYYLIDCDAENPDGIDVAQNGGSPIKTRNSRFNTTTSTTEFEYI